ncbi:MAG: colanic acid biosynthesis glycosyltransferase WcaL, partial [Actinomycetota bacterium]|nr:colanic acid biosynthesis glycosyltransferase WcaL [Actinomycetota bacterium]
MFTGTDRDRPRVGYVLKVYPRFSETFVVNEILAHERAGADLRIFSLRPPLGGRFHPAIGSV